MGNLTLIAIQKWQRNTNTKTKMVTKAKTITKTKADKDDYRDFAHIL